MRASSLTATPLAVFVNRFDKPSAIIRRPRSTLSSNCRTPFKHPVLPEGQTVRCPRCGASHPSDREDLPDIDDALTKPGTGYQLLNAAKGKEIMAVRCLCGHLFDFPRWEVGKCPACEREFLIPPPPEADQDRWMTDPRDEGA